MSGEYYNPYGSSPEPLYTRKPTEGPAPTLPEPPKKKKSKAPTKLRLKLHLPSFRIRRHTGRWVMVAASIIVLAGIVFAGYRQLAKSPIPKSISRSIKFKPYYPSKLPGGYWIDKKSFAPVESTGFLFNIMSSDGRTINVTEEALPSAFRNNPPGKQSDIFQIPAGEAQTLSLNTEHIGYIVTDSTLIVFNLGNTPITDFHLIAGDFRSI